MRQYIFPENILGEAKPSDTEYQVMARSKQQWHAWFKRCMLLPDAGFVPSDPAAKLTSPPSDVVAHWGAKESAGYVFRESDGEEYFLYVNELFTRVHQRDMVNRTLPLHFARGLLEESRGGQVNWAKFAMLRCFAGHKRTPFTPFPDFAEVNAPLPWIHPKVMPARPTDASPEQSEEPNQASSRLMFFNPDVCLMLFVPLPLKGMHVSTSNVVCAFLGMSSPC